MVSVLLPFVLGIFVLVVIVVVFPRFRPHYTSRLTCPKCGRTFDYNWIPGGSFTAVRLGGGNRYLPQQRNLGEKN